MTRKWLFLTGFTTPVGKAGFSFFIVDKGVPVMEATLDRDMD